MHYKILFRSPKRRSKLGKPIFLSYLVEEVVHPFRAEGEGVEVHRRDREEAEVGEELLPYLGGNQIKVFYSLSA